MSSSGVGTLVMEKKPKQKTTVEKKRKQEKKKEEDESDVDSDEPQRKKAKKKQKSDSDDLADGSKQPAKRGQSSVDHSKPMNAQQKRHEEYFEECTAKQMQDFLALNQVGLPKRHTKDVLAWWCVYCEVLGVAAVRCPRCEQGKLKPNVKESDIGNPVKKGVTKLKCPGFFDEETDKVQFCNKTYLTDGEAVPLKKFKGLGAATDEDMEHLQQERSERKKDRDAHASDENGSSAEDENMSGSEKDDGDSAAAAWTQAAQAPDASAAMSGFISDATAIPLSAPSSTSTTTAAAASSSSTKPSQPSKPAASDKPPCKYGAACYRKNPDHIANFSH